MLFHNPLTVRETQELLNLAGFPCAIDGEDGPATRFALAAYRVIYPNRALTAQFDLLAAGLPFQPSADWSLSRAVLESARWFLAIEPREIGGQNRGPWIRFFSGGQEGDPIAWCAWFAAVTCLGRSEAALNAARTRAGRPTSAVAQRYDSPSCTTLLARAKEDGRLVTSLAGARPGFLALFLKPNGGGAKHVGIVEYVDAAAGKVLTIEGNAFDESDPGGRERVARHVRTMATEPMAFVNVDA